MQRTLVGIAAVAVLGGCQMFREQGPMATADLRPTKGSTASGTASFSQIGDKVRVHAVVTGLKPGAEHGFHVHEVGDCGSGDGMSTKGHFNPFGKSHAHYGGAERHAGDLPALKANKEGRANVKIDLDIITLTPGPASIIGRGLIVHADPDDYKTQPTGNAGARIACGVIKAN